MPPSPRADGSARVYSTCQSTTSCVRGQGCTASTCDICRHTGCRQVGVARGVEEWHALHMHFKSPALLMQLRGHICMRLGNVGGTQRRRLRWAYSAWIFSLV